LGCKELREISSADESNSVSAPLPKATKSVDYNRHLQMKRTIRLVLFVLAVAVTAACSRGHRAEAATERGAPELPPPTPDTTPIPALRTPARLILGVEGTPAAASASPAATPTPVP
jgi:hypothetical protein